MRIKQELQKYQFTAQLKLALYNNQSVQSTDIFRNVNDLFNVDDMKTGLLYNLFMKFILWNTKVNQQAVAY